MFERDTNEMISDHTKEGMRKVAAEEISNLDGLRRVYSNVSILKWIPDMFLILTGR